MTLLQRSSKLKAARGGSEAIVDPLRLVSLGARSLASIADQGATAAITFLSSVFVGRLLGAEALGVFAMTSVLVMAIRQAQAGAVLDPMSVFAPRRPAAEKPRYFGFVAALQVLWVGGLTLLAAIAAGLLWLGGVLDDDSFRAIVASLLFANVVTLQYMLRRRFYVDEVPQRALVQSLAFLALCLAAFALYAATARVSVVGVYLVLSGCSLVICLTHGQQFRDQFGLPNRDERRRYGLEHWRYGSWTLLAVPLSIVCYQAYFVVSGSMLSVEEAGYLKAADALIAPFSQVAIGVSLMFVPIAARRLDAMTAGAQLRYAARLGSVTLGLAAAYAAIVFWFGSELIDLIFGHQLAAAHEVVQVMALVPLFIATGVPAAIMLAAQRRSDLRFAAYGLAAGTSVLLGFPLVGWAGIDGAAWGLAISQATLSAALWFALAVRGRAASAPAVPAASDG